MSDAGNKVKKSVIQKEVQHVSVAKAMLETAH